MDYRGGAPLRWLLTFRSVTASVNVTRRHDSSRGKRNSSRSVSMSLAYSGINNERPHRKVRMGDRFKIGLRATHQARSTREFQRTTFEIAQKIWMNVGPGWRRRWQNIRGETRPLQGCVVIFTPIRLLVESANESPSRISLTVPTISAREA